MKKVAIIIPTYNRGHLLEKTIPSYAEQIGENFWIKEIIIVDDFSVDNTTNVVEKLKESYPIIKYYKLEKNSKQQVAKNKGIELLGKEIDYVYFGDDDAILIPNSINYLVETLEKYKADVVGARSLYAEIEENIENYEKFIMKSNIEYLKSEVVNFEKDIFNFRQYFEKPICVPVTQAYILVRKNILTDDIRFDKRYTNNCYREETDFILQLNKKGRKIMFDSRAIGINYPRNIATGGAHKRGILGRLMWYYWTIVNNNKFLDKNYEFLKDKNYVKSSKNTLKIKFVFIQGSRFLKNKLRKKGFVKKCII
ncbi:N-glycosyltransferase [Fusobacterium necrogenes]|uniref:N-glycosyltransferase n=1 Tax=Fusobacterium necrogenes TaxID=858 RepID=A0A377GVZ7_9FUSO|nr:glycosyltransferase [Fusobacterium necrogenes]STO31148.1 N-glycosyltransferase [Fusobacterium necrogenes]